MSLKIVVARQKHISFTCSLVHAGLLLFFYIWSVNDCFNVFHVCRVANCYHATTNSAGASSVCIEVTHNPQFLDIHSHEGLTLETSAFESLYGDQFTLLTQLMKRNYLVSTRECFRLPRPKNLRLPAELSY